MDYLLRALAIILIASGTASGASWYFKAPGSGSNNGTSWADAWTNSASIDWSGSGVMPGDTIYISRGTTGQVYTADVSIQKDGTPGNYITVAPGRDAGHDGGGTGKAIFVNCQIDFNGSLAQWNRIDGSIDPNFVGPTNHQQVITGATAITNNIGFVFKDIVALTGSDVTDPTVWFLRNADNITLRYVEVSGVTNSSGNLFHETDGTVVWIAPDSGDNEVTNHLYECNFFHDNSGQQFAMNGNAGTRFDLLTFRLNWLHNNGEDHFETGGGVTICDNVVGPCSGSSVHNDMFQHNGNYVKIYNNDVRESANGLIRIQTYPGANPLPGIRHSVYIFNNLFTEKVGRALGGGTLVEPITIVHESSLFSLAATRIILSNIVIANNTFFNTLTNTIAGVDGNPALPRNPVISMIKGLWVTNATLTSNIIANNIFVDKHQGVSLAGTTNTGNYYKLAADSGFYFAATYNGSTNFTTNNISGFPGTTNNVYSAIFRMSAFGGTNHVSVVSNGQFVVSHITDYKFTSWSAAGMRSQWAIVNTDGASSVDLQARYYLWDGTNLTEYGRSILYTAPTTLTSFSMHATNTFPFDTNSYPLQMNLVCRIMATNVTGTPDLQFVYSTFPNPQWGTFFFPLTANWVDYDPYTTNDLSFTHNILHFTNSALANADVLSYQNTSARIHGHTYQFSNKTNAPLFVDKYGGDFNLSPTDTAAVNQGRNLSAFFNSDALYRPRNVGGAWDIGAFELQETNLLLHLTFEDDFSDEKIDDQSGNAKHGYRFGRPGSTYPTNFPTKVSANLSAGTNSSGYAGQFAWWTNEYGFYLKDGQYLGVTNLSGMTNVNVATIAVWYRSWPIGSNAVCLEGDYRCDQQSAVLSAGTSTGVPGTWEIARRDFNTVNKVRWQVMTNQITFARHEVHLPDPGFPDQTDGDTLKWHHAAIVWSNGVHTVYYDGTNYGNYDISGVVTNLHIGANASAPYPFLGVGCYTHGGTPALENEAGEDYPNHGWWNGLIDDVRFYNRLLSAAEIATIAGIEAQDEGGGELAGSSSHHGRKIGRIKLRR